MSATHVRIQDVASHVGETVTIDGWLHNRRSSGKIHFLQLRDGSGFIQAVMSKAAVGEDVFTRADHLSQETALSVTGTVRADTRAPGGYEIDATGLEVHSPSVDYPITPKEHGVDYLLDRRHLWIRSPRQQAILRVRHEVIDAVRDYFNGRGLHPLRHADLHAGRMRGHDDPVPGAVLRGHDGVPDAERAAVQRGERDGARQGVLLRPDVPRGEVEDPPASDRVLDGGAGDGVRRPRRRHRARGGLGRGRRRARARQAPRGAEGARARHLEARGREDAVPADHLRRGREAAHREGAARSSTGATSAGPTRPCCRSNSTGPSR